jgi:hypothetical protein
MGLITEALRMRDPEMFKFDVRVRERMLRAGRINADDVNRVLEALPDLETTIESVPLNQPALDVTASVASANRQPFLAAPTAGGLEDKVQDTGGST